MAHKHFTPPVVLSIAGSDSSAGAGIQADLKTISANGGYACTVITAVTAQNTQGVYDVCPLSPASVAAQIDAIFADFNVAAVKIGMLANVDIAKVVVDKLTMYAAKNVVVDPVMLSTSGRELLCEEAIAYCKAHLYPLATLLTPNIPEFMALTGNIELNDFTQTSHNENVYELARQQLGCQWLLIKGGHGVDPALSTDQLVGQHYIQCFSAPRIQSRNTHGTGCTLSSAIATSLAKGMSMAEAVEHSKRYLTLAIINASHLELGQGHGALQHFPIATSPEQYAN
ncbi:bifunctional hydroxymethylpyrimidine kinase/phosphomethylpyrimidine kinase [Enterovibrio sp. FF113]|uniref:bifunctional hydroxymethylpyrimidine kinase/phosphomethylpyrimidine kinase n=1 Tax=Enterovibrio sp. FF113 TaxID=3230010 RepID=UPI00352C580B